jgi:hypothetical protein
MLVSEGIAHAAPTAYESEINMLTRSNAKKQCTKLTSWF